VDRHPLHATLEDDPLARTLGLELLELGPGRCKAAVTVDGRHLNFQGHAHGAVLFALADFAFSGACNAHGEPAVALSVSIHFVSGVRSGARLVAEAREVRQGRRAGFYQMTVTGDDGGVVAIAQAVAHRPAR
jgi:acyl-CoA thioesterase